MGISKIIIAMVALSLVLIGFQNCGSDNPGLQPTAESELPSTTDLNQDSVPEALAASCVDYPILGSWLTSYNGTDDTISFNEDCTGASEYCQSQFTFEGGNSSSGTLTINVSNSIDDANCLPVGTHSCTYAIAQDMSGANYDCDGNVTALASPDAAQGRTGNGLSNFIENLLGNLFGN